MGENVEVACASCHGADGAGRSGGVLPNLTLQSPQYLYDALNAFATGQRQSGVMWELAGSLTDEQMRSLALRYGTAAPLASRTASTDPSAQARGADIVGRGLQDGGPDMADKVVATGGGIKPAQVERCSSCHLPGAYLGKVVPRLEGQYAAYTRMQLRAFQRGGRGNTSNFNPMVADSHNLDEKDIVAVADYYAAQAPLPKTKGDAPPK
jgi:cytochrome c553